MVAAASRWNAAGVSTRLVLVRHGHTVMNGGSPDPVMCGWTDLPMTPLGEQQVACLDHAIACDVVYTSPLRRARDTAAHVVTDRSATSEPGLREIGCGRVDGMLLREVERAYPDLWAHNQAEADDAFRWPGGESYAELRSRVVSTVDAIVERHPDARVAIVPHTGVITQLLGLLSGVSAARWSTFRVGNASISEVDWERGAGVVRSFDVRDHLPANLRT